MDNRNQQIATFLNAHGWAGAMRRTLADDASFRRYERLDLDGQRAVLMDAPPDKEDVRPFVAIADILRRMYLSAPQLYARDVDRGFLLLEDLGDNTYTKVLSDNPEKEDALYARAIELLIALHTRFTKAPDVPPYDDTRLHAETNLMLDWYFPAVTGKAAPSAIRRNYASLWRGLFERARAVPNTLILRDYHVDNLMWLPERPDEEACGLLDFQDAVIGPLTYDLVSLFEDARRDVPDEVSQAGLARYLSAFPDLDREAFRTSYAIFGVQRSAKILGVFTRLDRRDHKPDYLCHLPRVWRWLEVGLSHPVLSDMRAWFDRHLPPEFRTIPIRMTRQCAKPTTS